MKGFTPLVRIVTKSSLQAVMNPCAKLSNMFNIQKAIEEMDQKSCEASKALNLMRYEREKKERKLKELQKLLEQMQKFENLSPEQLENKQVLILCIETSCCL